MLVTCFKRPKHVSSVSCSCYTRPPDVLNTFEKTSGIRHYRLSRVGITTRLYDVMCLKFLQRVPVFLVHISPCLLYMEHGDVHRTCKPYSCYVFQDTFMISGYLDDC